jgi:lipid-binding SYLF domain-containing protein
LIRQAKAVLIVPRLIKGGFVVGGEGGDGVLMVQQQGTWSDPGFYAIGAASFGLQVGLEQSEMIMLIMTQKGLDGVLHDNFKIGAQAGVSVVTLGSGVEGAVGGASLPDVVVWSSSTGLYGGLTVDGSVIRAEPNQDAAFYGHKVTTHDVLFGSMTSPRAATLRKQMNGLG